MALFQYCRECDFPLTDLEDDAIRGYCKQCKEEQ